MQKQNMKLTPEQQDSLNVDVAKAIGWTAKHWLSWSSDTDTALTLLKGKRWELVTWKDGYRCTIIRITVQTPLIDGSGSTIPEAICRAVIAESEDEKKT